MRPRPRLLTPAGLRAAAIIALGLIALAATFLAGPR